MRRNKNRYDTYKCKNVMHHIQSDGKVQSRYTINISKYVPIIIKNMIKSIPNKLNTYYIICPYYKKYYDYQIGITETIKTNESYNEAIQRGVNEECGLHNVLWNNILTLKTYKQWYGVLINNPTYEYTPNNIFNDNKDTNDKVAIIIHDTPYKLLKVYKNVQIGDITSDGISGIGLISVEDCKNIVNTLH